MANWTGVITNAGTSLLGEWVDEKTLTITSAQAGTGTVPTAGLMAQTSLVNPKQTAAIAGGGEIQGGKRISLQVPAAQEAYTLNQFGVYAKVDEGSPVLLALYQNEQGIPIPSLSETPDFLYTFLAGISVSNQGHWEVTISASASLTWELVGVPNGIAGLDENGKVPKEQLPEMDAASVAYDNGSSGLVASTVQGALDELVTGLNEGTIAQVDATLTSTGWTGDTPTQTLSVPGLPANSPAWIGLAVTATAAQRDAARKAALSPTARAAGSVTITADGAQPTTDLPVTVYYVKKAPEGGTAMLASIINMFPGGSTLQIPLNAPTALIATAGNAQVSLTWTDPKDKYATPEGEIAQDPDQLVSKWAYTRIVRKVGSQPSGPNDGTTVLESAVRNQYQTEPFVDTGLQNEVTYYYGAFAYNEDGVVSDGVFGSAMPQAGRPLSELTEGTLIKINENGSPVEFYVAKQGYEPTLNGPDRVLMVRKDIHSNMNWGTWPNDNMWMRSIIEEWCETTYKALLSQSVQTMIATTTIIYYVGGDSAIATQTGAFSCFVLAAIEMNEPFVGIDDDGTPLPIASALDIAYLNGVASPQWTRTANINNSDTAVYVNASGVPNSTRIDYGLYGARPCFTLPKSALVDSDNALIES